MGQKPGTDPNQWMPKCGAQLRKKPTGVLCKKAPLKGETRCEFHGGKSPEGRDSPHFKTGLNTMRYRDAFKNHSLGKRLEAAHEDSTLMELVGEIALLQAIIEDLCSRFENNGDAEGKATIKEAKKVYKEMVTAGIKKDMKLFNHLLEVLGDTLDSAQFQFALIEEVKSAVKTKKELVDSQTKREFQLEQMMKAEDVKLYVVQLLAANRGIIYDRIEDKEFAESILEEIAGEFGRLIGGSNSGGLNAALPEG